MKMEELNTSTMFFLLAMDGLPVGDISDARNAVIRSYHAAASLESGEEPSVVIPRAGRLFRKTIASEEMKAIEEAGNLLSTVDSLKMLTVDAMFSSSREKVYRADHDLFAEASGRIRESVESHSLDDSVAMLIWLLREAGCLPEFLGKECLETLKDIPGIQEFPLWNEFIGKKLELGEKRKVDSYPECDRFEPVFVENILLKGDDRLQALIAYIESGDHIVDVIDNGLKIDNRLYSCNMDAVLKDRIERRGVYLTPMIGERT